MTTISSMGLVFFLLNFAPFVRKENKQQSEDIAKIWPCKSFIINLLR